MTELIYCDVCGKKIRMFKHTIKVIHDDGVDDYIYHIHGMCWLKIIDKFYDMFSAKPKKEEK